MGDITVPEGKSGDWSVERFAISRDDALIALFSYKNRAPFPGEYTRLRCNGAVIMSDTYAEKMDHWEPIHMACRHILINGLGLGYVLLKCMEKPEVERATVVEISPDVIKLVWPHYKKMFGDKIEIIQADAMTWKPPKDIRYGMVWHDIWNNICGDNYEQMKTLHRRYGRRCDWQGSWCRNETMELSKY